MILASSCTTKPYAIDYSENKLNIRSGKNLVYIINHGRHTGFAVPSEKLFQEFPLLRPRFGDPAFFELGWGDHDFYQADEITLWLKLQAILWPTDTVMHVVAVPKNPRKYFHQNDVVEITLNDSQFAALNRFLCNSFFQDNSGHIIPLKKGNYGDSQFYKGSGEYHLFNTCNKWTSKGLQSAGMNISPTFQITADGIMDYLKNNSHEQRQR